MSQRTDLQVILEGVLGTDKVYFQPPSTLRMSYPCIVYERSSAKTTYADNDRYNSTKRYTITVMDSDPDSPIPDKIAALSLCSFDRHFVAANLNHDVFNLYF